MKQLKREKPTKAASSFQNGPEICAAHTAWGASSQTRPSVPPKDTVTTKRNNGRENSSSVWGLVEMRSDLGQ